MSVVFSQKQVARTKELLSRLSGAIRTARFYPENHPAVRGLVAELMGVIGEYHSEGVDIPLATFEGELLLGEQVLTEASIVFDQLIRDLEAIGVGSVTFLRDLSERELGATITILATDPDSLPAGGAQAMLGQAGVAHVEIGTVTVADEAEEVEPGKEREAAKRSYMAAVDLLRDLEQAIRASQSSGGARHVRGVVQSLTDGVLRNRYAMLEMSGLKNYDEYTFFHSVNVAILSLAIGSAISTDHRFLSSLGIGALMHDIGKLEVPSELLNKPGTLTSDEWALVRDHPVLGAQAAARISGLDKSCIVVIFEHHLRYDMGGYPSVERSGGQHLASRIVSIADAYDAMTSRRSYSDARLADEAVTVLLKNMGTAFDPGLVRLFVDMIGAYPPRSLVRLVSGDVAVVLRPNEGDVLRPVVRVIADKGGSLHEPYDVDLSEDDDAARAIETCLDPGTLDVDIEDFFQEV